MRNVFRDAFRSLKSKLVSTIQKQEIHMAAAPPPDAEESRVNRRLRQKEEKKSTLHRIARDFRRMTRELRSGRSYVRPAASFEARARALAEEMLATNRAFNATRPRGVNSDHNRRPTSMATLRRSARRRVALLSAA